jgi:hypothetical protein
MLKRFEEHQPEHQEATTVEAWRRAREVDDRVRLSPVDEARACSTVMRDAAWMQENGIPASYEDAPNMRQTTSSARGR